MAPPLVPAPGVPLTAPPAPRPQGLTLESTIAEALGMRTQEANRLAKLGLHTVPTPCSTSPASTTTAATHCPSTAWSPACPPPWWARSRRSVRPRWAAKSLKITEAKVADRTGVIVVRWFNQAHVAEVLKPHVGSRIAVSGQPEVFNGKLQFARATTSSPTRTP